MVDFDLNRRLSGKAEWEGFIMETFRKIHGWEAFCADEKLELDPAQKACFMKLRARRTARTYDQYALIYPEDDWQTVRDLLAHKFTLASTIYLWVPVRPVEIRRWPLKTLEDATQDDGNLVTETAPSQELVPDDVFDVEKLLRVPERRNVARFLNAPKGLHSGPQYNQRARGTPILHTEKLVEDGVVAQEVGRLAKAPSGDETQEAVDSLVEEPSGNVTLQMTRGLRALGKGWAAFGDKEA